MRPFQYAEAESYSAAAKLLAGAPLALPKAGGSDLIDLLKEGLVQPSGIVALRRIPLAKGSPNVLQASLTLAQLAGDAHLREHFPALCEAAAEAATPQVRNQGTLGGNLCQVTRCSYLRTRHECLRLGDAGCAAAAPKAFTRFNGVFPAGGCHAGHSSSLAPALLVLGAELQVQGSEGARALSIDELYGEPTRGRLGDTTLRYDELIERVALQPNALTASSTYLEVRERQSFDFALVNLAAAATFEGSGDERTITEVRLAAGGIAPTPRRLKRAEAALRGQRLTEATLRKAAEAACAGAQPTRDNQHKPVLLGRLIGRALRALSGGAK